MDEQPPKKRPRIDQYQLHDLTENQTNCEENMTEPPTTDNQSSANFTPTISYEAPSEEPVMNAIPQQEVATNDSNENEEDLADFEYLLETLKRALGRTENIENFVAALPSNRTETLETQEDVLNEELNEQDQQMSEDNLNEDGSNIAESKFYLKPAEDENENSPVDSEKSDKASFSGTSNDASQESVKTEDTNAAGPSGYTCRLAAYHRVEITTMNNNSQDTSVAGPSSQACPVAKFQKSREYVINEGLIRRFFEQLEAETIPSTEKNVQRSVEYFTESSTYSRRFPNTVFIRAPMRDSNSSSSDDESPESPTTVTSSEIFQDALEDDVEETATASSPEGSCSITSEYCIYNGNNAEVDGEEGAEEQSSVNDQEVEADGSQHLNWITFDSEEQSVELNDIECEIVQGGDELEHCNCYN